MKKNEQRPVAGMGRGRLLDGETGGNFLAVYSKVFYALRSACVLRVHTHVYNVTVVVTAVSQHES